MINTKDLGVFENGNGGEITIQNNDVLLADQLYQQAYIALFGGNVEANTRGDEVAGQIRQDWWGNSYLFGNTPNKQFNSETERALNNNPLTSKGSINIINAVKTDLKYLSSVASVTVDATVLSAAKIVILITLTIPKNNQTAVMQITWDNAKNELIIDRTI